MIIDSYVYIYVIGQIFFLPFLRNGQKSVNPRCEAIVKDLLAIVLLVIPFVS